MGCSLPYLPPPPPPFLLFYMLIAAGTVSRQFKPFYRPLVHSFMTNLVLLTSPLHKPSSPLTSWQPKAAAQTFQLHLETLCHQNFIFSTRTWQSLFGLTPLPMFRAAAEPQAHLLRAGISAASHKEGSRASNATIGRETHKGWKVIL